MRIVPPGTGHCDLARSIHPECAIRISVALAYASHEPALKGDLTALENLSFMVSLKRRVTAAELRASWISPASRVCGFAGTGAVSGSAAARGHGASACDACLLAAGRAVHQSRHGGFGTAGRLLAKHVNDGGLALVVAHHELNMAAELRRLELAA